MRSKRGFFASIVLLLAVPTAVLYEMALGSGAGVVIHGALAVGSALMSRAVFDFKTPPWATWLGAASSGVLALVFFLQGGSDLGHHEGLTHLAYRVLGQGLEGRLADLFMVWCLVLLVADKHARTKVLGAICLASFVGVEVYGQGLAYHGTSLDARAPILKLLWLAPFVWLLVESAAGRGATASQEPGR